MRNVKRNEFLFVEEIFVKNSFEKGKRSTFFFAKKKKVSKKKLATLQVDGLSGFIPKSPLALRESLRERRAFRLTKGISPLDGSLNYSDRMEAFLLYTDETATPPRADFIPSEYRDRLADLRLSPLGAK